MSRTGVTYEEIELQAESLLAKGENPTIEKIRRALGDRGSNSTISRYVNEWRNQRKLSNAGIHAIATANLSVASDCTEIVNAAVNRVWQQLQDEALTKIAAAKEEARIQAEATSLEAKEEARLAIAAAQQQKLQLQLDRDKAYEEAENLRYEINSLKSKCFNLETQEYRLQLTCSELKQQARMKEDEIDKLYHENQKIEMILMEKEKKLANYQTEIFECKRLAEDRKEQNQKLNLALRNEREIIARLEERLLQVKKELELAQNFMKDEKVEKV